MIDATRLYLRVRVAWWLRLYFAWLTAVYVVTRREPRWQRVERVVGRAMRVEAD